MGSNTVEVNDQNFESDVLKSEIPTLVDFWAEWCGPCRMIAPRVDALAEKYQGQLKVAKLNVDDSQQSAIRFGVRSIPTLILFIGGREVERLVGAADKETLQRLIETHVVQKQAGHGA